MMRLKGSILGFVFLLSVATLSANKSGFIVGDMQGQLGNQLFIVAATVSLAIDHNCEALFPDFNIRNRDRLEENYRNVFWRLNRTHPKKKPKFFYEETYFHYCPINYQPMMRLKGYFQSEKYFLNHRDEILKLFEPSPQIVQYLREKYGQLLDSAKTVSVHIRTYCADLLNNPRIHEYYPFPGKEYYERAIYMFPEDSLFLVCSDDILWCKENLSDLGRNIIFIEGEKHYHDLYLMSMCQHNIISNSSFSWWAAYLNPNPDKIVVVPAVWFGEGFSPRIDESDLRPESWVVVK